MRQQLYPHIIADPDILSGKPVIEGTQVPVSRLVEQVATGRSITDVAQDADISPEDVRAALEFAAHRADEAVTPPYVAAPSSAPASDGDDTSVRTPEAEAEARALGLDPAHISPLGWELLEARVRIIASGVPLLSWEELDAEMDEQRGDDMDDMPD